jgi:hypothetical protein
MVHNLVQEKEVCCKFGGMGRQVKIDTEHQCGGVAVGLRKNTYHSRSEQADTEEAVYLPPISVVISVSTQHQTVAV